MAWIAVRQSLLSHRKTMAVAHSLGISEARVVGHLVTFWLWALDNTRDGKLWGVTPNMIARVAQWEGDPSKFVKALLDAGFLDRDGDLLIIHDWLEHVRGLVERREEV